MRVELVKDEPTDFLNCLSRMYRLGGEKGFCFDTGTIVIIVCFYKLRLHQFFQLNKRREAFKTDITLKLHCVDQSTVSQPCRKLPLLFENISFPLLVLGSLGILFLLLSEVHRFVVGCRVNSERAFIFFYVFF